MEDLEASPEAGEARKIARLGGATAPIGGGWEMGKGETLAPRPIITPRPTTPPAPGWLPEYVPGEVAGQPISKRVVPTPSGQQLTKMPWSQVEGLAGYAEFTGGRPWRDILAHAELMLPKGRGYRTTWTPAKQKTFA